MFHVTITKTEVGLNTSVKADGKTDYWGTRETSVLAEQGEKCGCGKCYFCLIALALEDFAVLYVTKHNKKICQHTK